MKPKNRKHNAFDCAKKMPPLRHSIPGEDFDITKSEVAQWLVAQPEIMQHVFNQANNSHVMAYDPDAGTWSGTEVPR